MRGGMRLSPDLDRSTTQAPAFVRNRMLSGENGPRKSVERAFWCDGLLSGAQWAGWQACGVGKDDNARALLIGREAWQNAALFSV